MLISLRKKAQTKEILTEAIFSALQIFPKSILQGWTWMWKYNGHPAIKV
jgi:hypothetical protein